MGGGCHGLWSYTSRGFHSPSPYARCPFVGAINAIPGSPFCLSTGQFLVPILAPLTSLTQGNRLALSAHQLSDEAMMLCLSRPVTVTTSQWHSDRETQLSGCKKQDSYELQRKLHVELRTLRIAVETAIRLQFELTHLEVIVPCISMEVNSLLLGNTGFKVVSTGLGTYRGATLEPVRSASPPAGPRATRPNAVPAAPGLVPR
jgi:hypothetical protein